jgi:hypothetical protein
MNKQEKSATEALNWAMQILNQSETNAAIVVKTPWSSVFKISTPQGPVYLKQTPALLALEASIIQILHDQFHASVPTVIAHNAKLNCFLMKDAGRPLREILKNKFNEKLVCKAIDQFSSLQIAVADHVEVFLDIGVPDWRLDKLPDLYKELLSQKELLIEEGLSEIEVNELKKLLPTVSSLCEKLSGYSIKQTIVQPDFNDNNILIADLSQDITLIDLGEISISHPFFPLLNCLHQVGKHHGLTDNDDAYLRIKEACLKNYMHVESKENLLAAVETTQILWFVYGALAQYRLMQACGKERLIPFQQKPLNNTLKGFIAACITIDG